MHTSLPHYHDGGRRPTIGARARAWLSRQCNGVCLDGFGLETSKGLIQRRKCRADATEHRYWRGAGERGSCLHRRREEA
eukprot:scaffold154702_cov27-Tisochrysis_lutea.AAC.6